jgi:hypothetical protein
MSTKYFLLGLALFGGVLPASGCGGHKPGVATGVDEPPQELTKEEEAAERANERKLLKPK